MMLMWLCCFSISSMCSLKWAWKSSGSLLERRKLPRHSNSFSKCKVRTTNVQDTIYSAYTNWLWGNQQKQVALKCQFSQLVDFGSTDLPDPSTFRLAEGYLCSVLSPKNNCETFDDLRCILYTKKNTPISSLPPISRMLHRHLLRCHYIVRTCRNLLSDSAINLLLERYWWFLVSSVLTFLHNIYTVTCGYKKTCSGRCKCQRSSVECTELCKCSGKDYWWQSMYKILFCNMLFNSSSVPF